MIKGSFDNAHLVTQSRNGDATAYDALVWEHCGMVRAIALARLGPDPEIADEVVQEVFLRAWLHLKELSSPERFPAWLCQITRNLSADWKRRERSKSALVQMVSMAHAESAATADDVSPQEKLVHDENLRALEDALKKLPANQRELLLLHFSENLSQSEIARRFQVHPSTVTRKLNAATQRLRRLHDKAVESLPAYRTCEKSIQRTSAVIAGAYALNATQRTALAVTSSKTLAIPKIGTRYISFFGNPLGHVAAAACVLGLTGVALFSGVNVFDRSWASSDAEESNGAFSTNINLPAEVRDISQSHSRASMLRSNYKSRVLAQNSSISDKKISTRSSTENNSATSATSAAPDAANAVNDYVIVNEQPDCISLEQLQKIIASFEQIAGSATYTFNTSQTILGRTAAENFIADRQGTSTLKGNNYEIQHRVTNRPSGQESVETISFDSVTDTVTVSRPGGKPRIFTDINRHTSAKAYDPLKALLRPPYGDSNLMSEFVVAHSADEVLVTTCTVGSNSSRRIYFGGVDWAVRLDPENSYFPDYFQITTGPDHRIQLEKVVTRFDSINGISYPSEFAIRTYALDESGNLSVVNATTASLKMLDIGIGAPGPSNEVVSTSTVEGKNLQTSQTLSPEGTARQQQRELDHRSRIQDILRRTR